MKRESHCSDGLKNGTVSGKLIILFPILAKTKIYGILRFRLKQLRRDLDMNGLRTRWKMKILEQSHGRESQEFSLLMVDLTE